MNAVFGAQKAVGVGARDRERDVFDARVVTWLEVDDLGLEALVLTPAEIHAHQHLGPVLGVDAARARADVDDGVRAILRAAEHARELDLAHASLQAVELLGPVGDHRLVVFRLGHLEQLGLIADLGEQLVVVGQALLDVCALTHQGARLVRIVPKPLALRAVVQAIELATKTFDVKDTSPAFRGAVRGLRGLHGYR